MEKIDKHIRRTSLSKITGMSLPYLSKIFKEGLPAGAEDRIYNAVLKIIKELTEATNAYKSKNKR